MAEMITETIKWAVSIGTAGVVLVFVFAAFWSFWFGYKAWPGMLNLLEARRHKHEDEQTAMRGDADKAATKAEASALNLATKMRVVADAQNPPDGLAWVAQAQVAYIAATIEQLQVIGTEVVKTMRLIGSQFPVVRDEISVCCDTIEREVKRFTENLLREQERARQAAEKTVNRA